MPDIGGATISSVKQSECQPYKRELNEMYAIFDQILDVVFSIDQLVCIASFVIRIKLLKLVSESEYSRICM